MADLILVMGGSFNPPTIAHLKLMQAALDQLTKYVPLDAIGVFVPSSDAYVHRKMLKLSDGSDRIFFPEKARYEMLQSFRDEDSRLFVDGRELGSTAVRGHTIETLRAIQHKDPNADILFIFGGDKLGGLSSWGSFEAMVNEFKIILFDRGNSNLLQTIENTPALAKHRNSFVILHAPEGMEKISSTAVRKRLLKRMPVDDMVTSEVGAMCCRLQDGNAINNNKS